MRLFEAERAPSKTRMPVAAVPEPHCSSFASMNPRRKWPSGRGLSRAALNHYEGGTSTPQTGENDEFVQLFTKP
jgi:hypothetical protein